MGNLSLYINMAPGPITRDISLDVEPSERLQLHAQGSNVSNMTTISRSIKTNAMSEGHELRQLTVVEDEDLSDSEEPVKVIGRTRNVNNDVEQEPLRLFTKGHKHKK